MSLASDTVCPKNWSLLTASVPVSLPSRQGLNLGSWYRHQCVGDLGVVVLDLRHHIVGAFAVNSHVSGTNMRLLNPH